VKELPEDLAALDVLLADHEVLWPLVERWRQEFRETGRLVLTEGRPTIALESYVRLMVLKQRYRWGYRTLQAEGSDSIHLRRFCRISLSEPVPVESTVRKLTRRIGPETVSELTRVMIVKATREKRFRPRAVRIDSTVIEADVKYPTRRGPGLQRRCRVGAGGSQARRVDRGEEGAGAGSLAGDGSQAADDHAHGSSSFGGGQAGSAHADRADRRAAGALDQGSAQARADRTGQRARAWREGEGEGRGGVGGDGRSLREGRPSDQQRVAGEPIKDRIVSLHDPDARPIRKGKLGKPNEFGYASQLAEVTDHTKRGARGLILPASTEIGNPAEDTLLPGTIAELQRLGITVQEVALDGGFNVGPTNAALEDLAPKNVFIAGRQEPASKRTARRMRRYRTGAEGRISHLKRRYGLDRSRLKGDEGRQIWTEWSIMAYNADTLAVRER
jgi:IS5 family transposase